MQNTLAEVATEEEEEEPDILCTSISKRLLCHIND